MRKEGERMEGRVQPFYCGTQILDWETGNCSGCAKYNPDANDVFEMPCPISKAMFYAFWTDGTVSHKIADMMGRPEGRYTWPCPSRDPMWLDFVKESDELEK